MRSKALLLLPLLAVSSGLVYIQAAHAQPLSEPKWPQGFGAAQGKPAVFTFPITQPGPVSVSVQSGAAPVLVTLFGPVRSIQKGGMGNVQIAYAATAADVQNRYLWSVVIESPNAPTAVQGSVSVSHPPADMNLVIPHAQKLLQHDAQVAANRAANAAKVQRALAEHEQARQEASQRLAAAQAQKTQQLLKSIGAPATPGVQTRAVPAGALTVRPGTIVNPPNLPPLTATPPPGPVISDVSPREGQPGDPILITGSNFGTTGQVHFVVNPGMNLIAPVDHWSDTQIVAHVPDASGILQRYFGQVYVIVPRPAQPRLQQVQPFTFDPQRVSVDIYASPFLKDRNVAPDDDDCFYVWACPGNFYCGDYYQSCSTTHYDRYQNLNGYQTYGSGNDEWYLTTNLRNGWVLQSRSLYLVFPDGHEEATIVDDRPPPSLYTKVHWRQDPGHDAGYLLVTTINGPKGTDPGVR